jgi:hypothetical protein
MAKLRPVSASPDSHPRCARVSRISARASRRCTQASRDCARANPECVSHSRMGSGEPGLYLPSEDGLGRTETVSPTKVGLGRIGIASPTKVGLGRIKTASPTEVGLGRIETSSPIEVSLGRVVTASSESCPRASYGLGRAVASGALWPRASCGLRWVVSGVPCDLRRTMVSSTIEGSRSPIVQSVHTYREGWLLPKWRTNGSRLLGAIKEPPGRHGAVPMQNTKINTRAYTILLDSDHALVRSREIWVRFELRLCWFSFVRSFIHLYVCSCCIFALVCVASPFLTLVLLCLCALRWKSAKNDDLAIKSIGYFCLLSQRSSGSFTIWDVPWSTLVITHWTKVCNE